MFMFNYTKIFLILIIVSLSGCSQQEPLKVALHNWVGYQFTLINQDKFASQTRHEFEISKTQNATETLNKFAKQEIQAGYLTLDEVLLARDQGIPLSVLLVTDISAGADVVIARKSQIKAADIIGKTIAYEPTALGKLMLKEFLNKHNLNSTDVFHVDMPINKHEDIFKDNNVDYLITYYPYAEKILDDGKSIVFSSQEIPNTIIDVLAINTAVAKPNSDKACQLVKRHLQGVEYLYYNHEDTKYQLASIMQTNKNSITKALSKISIPSFIMNQKLLAPDGEIHGIAHSLNQLMQSENILQYDKPLTDLINNKCLMDILESEL